MAGNRILKYADGLIEQWGCSTISFIDTSRVISLPVRMSDANYSVMTFPARSSGTSAFPLQINGRDNKTVNSFKITTNGEYNQGFDYIIKGY